MRIIDCDTHLFEARDLWHSRSDPADRELALRIDDDARGYAWLRFDGRPIHLAEVHTPGELAPMGVHRARERAGEPAAYRYDDALPAAFRDAGARCAWLDEQGLDEAFVFPHYGLFWMRTLEPEPRAQRANLRAWNRFAVDVARDGGGRLHPVGHVFLRDLDWLRSELAELARGGVRLAMLPPTPADGRALSHPDHDAAWSAFVEHGIAPIFHISDFARPFDDAWYAGDVNPVEPLIMSAFISTPPTLALLDMATGGVFERHPELRLGLVEFTAGWLPPFLRALDVCWEFHAAYNGLDPGRLALRPADYVRRQVRVATTGHDPYGSMVEAVGEVFMFGSDWPHAEGMPEPLTTFLERGQPVPGPASTALYAGNAAWLLGQGS